jgi:hypothetical protein
MNTNPDPLALIAIGILEAKVAKAEARVRDAEGWATDARQRLQDAKDKATGAVTVVGP